MGTNCFPFSSTYSYEMDFKHYSEKTEKRLSRCFNFTFRYTDDVLSIYNGKFVDFVDRIYPIGLEKMIPQIQLGLLHSLPYTSKLTNRAG